MMKTASLAFLTLTLAYGSALAFGGGFGGGGVAAIGMANPLKYYPICPRGRAGVSCQCRIGHDENANQLCSPGEYCNTGDGTCGPTLPRRR